MDKRELAAHGLARASRAGSGHGEVDAGRRGVDGAVARRRQAVEARPVEARRRRAVRERATLVALGALARAALVPPGRVARQPGRRAERRDEVEHPAVHRRLPARRRRRLHLLAERRRVELRARHEARDRIARERRRARAVGRARSAARLLQLPVQDDVDAHDVEGVAAREPVGAPRAVLTGDQRQAAALGDGRGRREADGAVGKRADRVVRQALHDALPRDVEVVNGVTLRDGRVDLGPVGGRRVELDARELRGGRLDLRLDALLQRRSVLQDVLADAARSGQDRLRRVQEGGLSRD